MPSIYQLKPRFQALLRPGVSRLHQRGVTANQVTVVAALVSVLLGLLLAWGSQHAWLFALLPLWMLLRMALNAVDGMLAREFGQQSRLGAYLNELCDLIADAALYLPFALLPGVSPLLWCWWCLLRSSANTPGSWARWPAPRGVTTGQWARATGPSSSVRWAWPWPSPFRPPGSTACCWWSCCFPSIPSTTGCAEVSTKPADSLAG